MNATRTVHVRIEGRVQGVYYRAWAQSAAVSLGLTGWIKNCHDRSVEAVFQGSPEAVGDMLRQCEQGPPDANVTAVEVVGEGFGVYDGFEVRRTG